ncbi:MAG: MbtH family protein [Rhodobacteraceae bacterium]|nr:MAG: MbtH family protein [Paracoccaceae bacterium]
MDGFDEFMVLINHEGQHSLWPTELEVPAGWTQVGPTGSEDVCLAYVTEHWTDITPLSARLTKDAEGEISHG